MPFVSNNLKSTGTHPQSCFLLECLGKLKEFEISVASSLEDDMQDNIDDALTFVTGIEYSEQEIDDACDEHSLEKEHMGGSSCGDAIIRLTEENASESTYLFVLHSVAGDKSFYRFLYASHGASFSSEN